MSMTSERTGRLFDGSVLEIEAPGAGGPAWATGPG